MDKTGFKNIFDSYFDAVRSYVYYRLADEDVASDITQDVFMRVWEKRETLDEKNIKPLLYKIASDMVVSRWRREAVRLDFSKNMTVTEKDLSPQELMLFDELKKRYSDTLAGMPESQRETFLMSREEGLKYREIAGRLGLSVKAVEKRMTAALKILKSKLL